jgi:hypothetical protein
MRSAKEINYLPAKSSSPSLPYSANEKLHFTLQYLKKDIERKIKI